MKLSIVATCLLFICMDKHGHIDPKPMLDEINNYRSQNGLPKLAHYYHGQQDADYWATQQIRYPRHPDVKVSFVENCASGYSSVEDVVDGWKKSPPHNRNLLNKQIKFATVSVYTVKYSSHNKYYSVFRGYTDTTKIAINEKAR